MPPLGLLRSEPGQLVRDQVAELDVLDGHEVDVLQAVTEDGEELGGVNGVLVDAHVELFHESLAHEWNFDSWKEEHGEAEARRDEAVGELGGEGVLDMLHLLGVVEGAAGVVDVPQGV